MPFSWFLIDLFPVQIVNEEALEEWSFSLTDLIQHKLLLPQGDI